MFRGERELAAPETVATESKMMADMSLIGKIQNGSRVEECEKNASDIVKKDGERHHSWTYTFQFRGLFYLMQSICYSDCFAPILNITVESVPDTA